MSNPTTLTKKDFASDQEVRWCPGCGDYAILSAIQKTMPELGLPKEDIVFVSGIGCSSRFPYYMNTYGFHTIHGRAPAVASGLKLMRPELSVWMITGDGDALSIGGNHLIHILRRNLDINILLFNNQIYGLTKGQYSPTSKEGTVAKSTPEGSLDHPFSALSLAIGAGATFAARVHDKDMKMMTDVFKAAYEHKGTSFIEIYQNCVIFNDGVFDESVSKDTRDEHTVYLQDRQPMLFGKEKDKGLLLEGYQARVVPAEDATDAVTIHDATREDPSFAFALAQLDRPHFPVTMGILRQVERPVYEELVQHQVDSVVQKKGKGDLEALIHSGDTWMIEN